MLGEDGRRNGGMRKRHCVWRTMFRTMLDVVPCKERGATGVTAKRSLVPSPRHIRPPLIGCTRHVHLQPSQHHGTGNSISIPFVRQQHYRCDYWATCSKKLSNGIDSLHGRVY